MFDDTRTLLSRKEAARYLQSFGVPTTAKSLSTLASRGGGPEYMRFGSRVLYRPEKLKEWFEAKLEGPFLLADNDDA